MKKEKSEEYNRDRKKNIESKGSKRWGKQKEKERANLQNVAGIRKE